jgi:hypothetical protein
MGYSHHTWTKRLIAAHLAPARTVVLLALSTFADFDTGENARPGNQHLMEMTGVSHATVDRAIADGIQRRLIVRTSPGRGRSAATFALNSTSPVRLKITRNSASPSTSPVRPHLLTKEQKKKNLTEHLAAIEQEHLKLMQEKMQQGRELVARRKAKAAAKKSFLRGDLRVSDEGANEEYQEARTEAVSLP